MTIIKQIKNKQIRLHLKLVLIGVLLLLLMIPKVFMNDLIRERRNFELQTRQEVATTWGEQQTITGPLLTVPYTRRQQYEDADGETKVRLTNHKLHIAPMSVIVNGDLVMTTLQRSIYDIHLYSSALELHASIPLDGLELDNVEKIYWEQAFVTIGISDIKGIEGNISATANEVKIDFNPSSGDVAIRNGVAANVNLTDQNEVNIDITMQLRGSSSLNFVPIAEQMDVSLTSDWTAPSFVGVISPKHRQISKEGFEVEWQSGKFNKSNPPFWTDGSHNFNGVKHTSVDDYSDRHIGKMGETDTFGVRLVEQVNHYQKVSRSAKYSLLILGLTFLVFFFFEIINGIRIHPIQYLLVGLSLTVFYLLLLSFTEQIGFDLAYWIASLAVIVSVVMYTYPLMQKRWQPAMLGVCLVALYGYIFILLQLEAFALLAGSVGVFLILVTIMYLSRKVDYYGQAE